MPADTPFSILVVDDEPSIAHILARMALTLFPEATITNTFSAQETLDLLDQPATYWPHLVLLDVNLHQAVNGLDLLPQLHQRFNGRVPIVMLTTSINQDDYQKAFDRGAVAFTQKPDGLQSWKEYTLNLRTTWYFLKH